MKATKLRENLVNKGDRSRLAVEFFLTSFRYKLYIPHSTGFVSNYMNLLIKVISRHRLHAIYGLGGSDCSLVRIVFIRKGFFYLPVLQRLDIGWLAVITIPGVDRKFLIR